MLSLEPWERRKHGAAIGFEQSNADGAVDGHAYNVGLPET
jgi:hypothetical protein